MTHSVIVKESCYLAATTTCGLDGTAPKAECGLWVTVLKESALGGRQSDS